jgi:hypothetical protein
MYCLFNYLYYICINKNEKLNNTKMKRTYKLTSIAYGFGVTFIPAYSRSEAINTLINNTSVKRKEISSCRLVD